MSKKSRKQFDSFEQQADDFYRGIKIVKPLISIIRELGKKENEFSKNIVQLWIEETNLRELSTAFSLFKINGISISKEQDNLKSEIKKRFEMLTKLDESLFEEINELQEKVNEYFYYIDESFSWVNEGVLRLGIKKYHSKFDSDDLLVILLIAYNRGFDDYELEFNEDVMEDLLNEYFMNFNFVLKAVQHNFDKVIDFIKER